MNIHFDNMIQMVGFSVNNTPKGGFAKVLTRAKLTSDAPDFYHYLEQIANIYLISANVFVDTIYQFLVVIHQDSSADLFINDIEIQIETKIKRKIKQGDIVTSKDIADIRKLIFPIITITETDKVIFCFKVGWRFGLFFDFSAITQNLNIPQLDKTKQLNIEEMRISIGELYRYLLFYHVYNDLETKVYLDEMITDGWFPFIEILSTEYKSISDAYQNKFDFDNKIECIVNKFSSERIKEITDKWWAKQVFTDKRAIIEAGIEAYNQNSPQGFINCIKNLWTEIEGILRKLYYVETGKGNNVKSTTLINYIVDKVENKTDSVPSLFLPTFFLKYLQDVVFSNFNIEKGNINMSRNSSSHGVADQKQYTHNRALQLILILDQIYYYI